MAQNEQESFDEKNPRAAAAHRFFSSNQSQFSADGEFADEKVC
jgi:hypothetical protein